MDFLYFLTNSVYLASYYFHFVRHLNVLVTLLYLPLYGDRLVPNVYLVVDVLYHCVVKVRLSRLLLMLQGYLVLVYDRHF